jgi:uncharacterized membrane protein
MSVESLVDDLGENVVGALAYSLGFVTGIIFYVLGKQNSFVRFHSVQSIVVFGGLAALSVGINILLGVFVFVPVLGRVFVALGGVVMWVVGLVGFVLWIVLLVKAYQGERFELPVVGPLASNYA